MSLEAAIAENTAALKEVASLLAASNAGREAALAKLAGTTSGDGDAAPKTTRKKKDEPAPSAPAAPAAPKAPTKDDLRALAETFLDEKVVPKGSEERKGRVGFIRSVIEHFGANPDEPGLIGAVPDEHIAWAIEALTIKAKNIASPVDFPATEEAPAAAEDEDDVDI